MVSDEERPETRSVAVTRGVRIEVQSEYVEGHSLPPHRYVFAYTVAIENHSSEVVQLRARHWTVTHGDGHVEEVEGPGVVGKQPILAPGQRFNYQSGCLLRTPRGTMHGTYRMEIDGGETFEAEIAVFALEAPYSLN